MQENNLNSERFVRNYFQELKVFENEKINALCDQLCLYCQEQSGEIPILTGSVAKMMSEQLPQDYQPKDLDFVVSYPTFRNLIVRLNKMEGVVMIEKRPRRIILYAEEGICIEIWQNKSVDKNKEIKKYKDKIAYYEHTI